MDSSRLYPLYAIAECDLYDSTHTSKLRIPNIQRGLVWKPIQVELLWDSILRGFPIGSMLVLHHEDSFVPDEILDGQQRANAIINGFDIEGLCESAQTKTKSILWYDLSYSPSEDKDEERRVHRICLTNTAHPWGFSTDGLKLEAEKRRKAIEAAYNYNIESIPSKKSAWDIRRFLPYVFTQDPSFLPIPLSFLVYAAKDKNITPGGEIPSLFFEDIRKLIDGFSDLSPWWRDSYGEKVQTFLTEHANDVKLFQPFFNLNSYSIPFNYVSTQDDIEILFNRVNRRGTPMSAEDLTYAAIKHYGGSLCHCDNISDVIKKACNGLLPEAVLANIVFRYCFSSNSIRGELSAGDIRNCNSVETKDNLQLLFSGDNLRSLIDCAKSCILKDNIPSFMLGEIGIKNPSLFILLLLLVDKHRTLGDDFIRGLIFYLYCFSVSNHPASLIFEAAKASPDNLKGQIQDILRDSISHEWAMEVPSSFREYNAAADAAKDTNWSPHKYSNRYGYSSFKTLFEYGTGQGAFMLKYSLRNYFNEVFSEYSPSNKDLWEDINRPWDHDHIIPKSWDDGHIWSNCFAAWVNSWGNIADIPFEENRIKNNYADWSYYDSLHGDPLLAGALYKPYCDDGKIDGLQKGNDQDIVQFISNVWDRFLILSDDFLSLFSVLGITDGLSPLQHERKCFFLRIQQQLESLETGSHYGLYYRTPSGIEQQIIPEKKCDWQKPWISLINMNEASWRYSISVYIIHEKDKTLYRIERGNRKSPEKAPDNDGWWENGTWTYCFRNELMTPDGTDIQDYLKYFSLGAFLFNGIHMERGLQRGFILEQTSLISFHTNIGDTPISISLRWPRYWYYHIEIRTLEPGTSLPDTVLRFGKENGYSLNNDSCIDKYSYREDADISKTCESFQESVEHFLNHIGEAL